MIITIICVAVFIASVVGAVVLGKVCWDDTPSVLCLCLATLIALPMFLGIAIGIKNNVGYEIDHRVALEKREAIVRRIEQQENSCDSIIVNGGYYMEIVEYNAKIYSDNKWGKNPWTSWYHGWDYADIDPIVISK